MTILLKIKNDLLFPLEKKGKFAPETLIDIYCY